MWAIKIIHEKNWRVSLFVQELHDPQNFLRILAANPGSQTLSSEHNGSLRSIVVSSSFVLVNLLVGFGLLVIGFTANNRFPSNIINIGT